MAIWCDEGVFHPSCDSCLSEPEHFQDLFIGIGPFHRTCVLWKSQGKHLHGSGIDDALVECGMFGPGVLESVLNGGHDVHAITACHLFTFFQEADSEIQYITKCAEPHIF